MKGEYPSGVFDLEEGDRVTAEIGRRQLDGTVQETFEDSRGLGIRLEMDRGDYKTIGPGHVVSIH